MEGHRERVKPFNDRAKEVHAEAARVYSYLEDWKSKIIKQSGGYLNGAQSGEIKNEADIDASTYLLVEKKGGDEIKKKLGEYREFLLARIGNPSVREALARDMPVKIENPPKSESNPAGDWSTGTFYHVPTLGVVALLSKMQNDVRSSEAAVVNELFKEAEAKPIKFDAITALAIPQTSYALVGQEVKAQIMVAAYNKSVSPTITASAGSVKVQDGVGSWTGTASGVGLQTVRGMLRLNLGDRNFEQPWSFQYMVGSAGASLQLDKMNVFYIGVPNPITVTAAGYSLEDVSINIPGARLNKTGNGKYEVFVTEPHPVKATISAKTDQGMKTVGVMDIRVKRIPDPQAKIGGKMGGTMQANVFRAQAGVAAVLENFDFDTKFTITGYDFSYQPKRGDYQGPFHANNAYFPDEAKRFIPRMNPGDRVYIDNVRAKAPDGTTRALNPITLLLN
jgi:gliding motility-associated protein GldM